LKVSEILLANEPLIRLSFFIGIFALVALLEMLAPRRRQTIPIPLRWVNNLGLVVVNTFLLRLAVPILAVGFALLAEDKGWGILNNVALPAWAVMTLSFLALDLTIYLQHVMFHAVPTLWRLHRAHHTDLEFDVTTGLRFHPLEIIISMGIKLAAIAVIGSPAVIVLVFEVMLNATSMFNHGNFRIPPQLDRFLRWFIVTPDMHRVHHSVYPDETNSNFGFNLPWWDRLLGTYRAQPRDDHKDMVIGVSQFRTPRDLWIDKILIQPFREAATRYPINRDGSE